MLALENISDNDKILITKGNKYNIVKEVYGYRAKYYVIDNYGNKLYITKEEMLSKFKLSRKENLLEWFID